MKFVKTILIIALSLAALFAAVWQFWLKGQVEFADIATAYGAKQVCSCRFVAERELDSCFGDFTTDISLIDFSVSSSEVRSETATTRADTVTASVLGGLIRNQARFEPGLGCTLVSP